ncbi:MAG: hypothetical protein HY681_15340 [Chloroflexi bacterium]|nr:hypothetical protein [Chloroflexota bacterium]
MKCSVEVHIQDGVVTVVNRSPDVEVEIRDYDTPETDSRGNQVSDCTVELYEAGPVASGPFCPEDGEQMRKVAEVGGGALTYYDCPSCDGWTYNAEDGEYIAGIPAWAEELQKAVDDAQDGDDQDEDGGGDGQGNLPDSPGDDGSIAVYR